MNCTRARDLLQLYLDGVLEASQCGDLEAHVGACQGCRSELVQLERLMLAIESLPLLSAPPRLVAQTMAAVARGSRWHHHASLSWAISASGVAAMAAGFLLALGSAENALVAFTNLMLEQESPATLVDTLLAVAAAMETPLIAGIGLLVIAACLTLAQLFARGPEVRAS